MSQSLSDVFIVVPAYNEGQVIRETLAPLLERPYSVVLVDDGSGDDTCSQASRLPVHLLRHPVNLGQGAALQTGITYALNRGARAIVTFDADGQLCRIVYNRKHPIAPDLCVALSAWTDDELALHLGQI